MAYYRRRRRTVRRSTYRGRASSRGRFRSRSTRVRRTARRSYSRRRTGSNRTIRLVVQTVAASPLSLGMKGNMPVRRMF